MKTFRILKDYTIQYEQPLVLHAGDFVNLGDEEKEEKWIGWIWAESPSHSGWIPKQILEISEDLKSGLVLEGYSAQELTVKAGDTIEKLKSLNGWTWARAMETSNEGWIPDEIIAAEEWF